MTLVLLLVLVGAASAVGTQRGATTREPLGFGPRKAPSLGQPRTHSRPSHLSCRTPY